MNVQTPVEKLLPKDYASDQEVRWCPGCGDYSILRAVQKTLADIQASRAETVFVSGIGCAARFPYYINTYGFHTIHGRAPAIATGVKLANPNLTVWVVGGDGDGLSIGGNHTMHAIRRNIDINYLLFNNEIYGLTKGQYSPTSRLGTKSPSTPMGSIDNPVSALSFAMGVGARFIARGIDRDQKNLPDLFARANAHKGASFVEVIQNCIVYNDGAFDHFAEKDVAADAQVRVVHGKPLVFGKDGKKGLKFDARSFKLDVVTIGENGVTEADILVHDEKNRMLGTLLASLEPPFPVALGVLYCDPQPSYDERVAAQTEQAIAAMKGKPADLNALFRRGHTWQVK
ncbi:MAG: 2-oxoacid:ferredoxin oxidoreductase subunit beta [Alphaproteobacteria bacterium]